jgi:hypothetical protein
LYLFSWLLIGRPWQVKNTQIVTVGAPGEDKKNDSGAKAPARQEKEGRGYRSRFS